MYEFDIWLPRSGAIKPEPVKKVNTGAFAVLNENGEADIDESAFHRLEMCI